MTSEKPSVKSGIIALADVARGRVRSLLDGSVYAGPSPFDPKDYHRWYEKHVGRPRRKAAKARPAGGR